MKTNRILVTGSSGLIGSALVRRINANGREAVPYDISAENDVRDVDRLVSIATGCDGIVHLAAVARPMWCERDPELCRSVNVDGTAAVVKAAKRTGAWLLFASSREVYGHTSGLTSEMDEPAPINHYGRSKLIGEQLVAELASTGTCAASVRLSNVYGSIDDHVDRVVPAFVMAARKDVGVAIEGNGVFDFVHVNDVVDGLIRASGVLASGKSLPTVQLTSGVGTSLSTLAAMTARPQHRPFRVTYAEPRENDPQFFVGSTRRAFTELSWQARVGLQTGIDDMFMQHFTRFNDEQAKNATPGRSISDDEFRRMRRGQNEFGEWIGYSGAPLNRDNVCGGGCGRIGCDGGCGW